MKSISDARASLLWSTARSALFKQVDGASNIPENSTEYIALVNEMDKCNY